MVGLAAIVRRGFCGCHLGHEGDRHPDEGRGWLALGGGNHKAGEQFWGRKAEEEEGGLDLAQLREGTVDIWPTKEGKRERVSGFFAKGRDMAVA